MAKASAQPSWEQLSDSSQRIYLALAEGDQQRARQLFEQDQRRPRRGARRPRRARSAAARAEPPPGRDLRGFVVRRGRLVPPEMAAAEAWKRRQARR
ncbi:MAG TPA: hypothetical protein VFD04_23600 [Actinomycetes bacterium]|nr:hypothetical protein [Actinomycetes bacterium]